MHSLWLPLSAKRVCTKYKRENDIKLKGLNCNFISRRLNIQFGSPDRISGDENALQMKSILVFLYLLIKI